MGSPPLFDYLQGELVELSSDDAVLDVHGHGYRVRVPVSTAAALGSVGRTVKVWTVARLRDDAWTIFGFATREERQMFESMCSVSSVGPAVALSLLSGIPTPEFLAAIAENNPRPLERVKGVGKKTAQRICLELKDRIGDWQIVGAGSAVAGARAGGAANSDAIAALLAIGFQPGEAEEVVERIRRGNPDAGVAEVVKLATQR